jgi:hypothetical protein
MVNTLLGENYVVDYFFSKLITNVTTAMMAKMTNKILAISTAPAAIPPKPKIAAINAITKKTTE